MAKKRAKPAKKSARKPAKKPARKPAKRAARSTAPAAPKLGGPFTVSTGSGAKPLELGNRLVQLFNEHNDQAVWDQLWAPTIASCEGFGAEVEWRGKDAAIAKNKDWMEKHIVHGGSAQGPYIGASGFAVHFEIDVEEKATGTRWKMTEVGVYTVKDGKIASERFFYNM